jgi:hypothetical protein
MGTVILTPSAVLEIWTPASLQVSTTYPACPTGTYELHEQLRLQKTHDQLRILTTHEQLD